jgi:hypothetical protein
MFIIPATQEAEVRRIQVRGQSWQKVSKISSQPKLDVVVQCTPVITAMQEA